MKRLFLIIPVIAITLISFKVLTSTSWKLDAVHSNLGFAILHFGVSDVKGTVTINSATITAPNEDFSDGTVVLEADMNTIDTDNDKRDAHLKTVDFFDTAKFPLLTFNSTSFKKVSEGKYTLNGNLSLHGVTKPVSLVAMSKTGLNPMNNKPIAGFKITGIIKRSDFDISVTTPVAILSDEVAIEANLIFSKE